MAYSKFDPLRDEQECPPVGECARCHRAVYNFDSELCSECEAEIRGTDIVVKYAEAFPRRLFKLMWEERNEDYMKEFLTVLREAFQGTELGGPDIEAWAKS